MNAILALEDGTIFEGKAFGATGTSTGEACFNTNAVGYQEILTDPAYAGQMVAMTYPHIGNYGICEEDNESSRPHVRGFVIGELSRIHSNWRANEPLGDWMARHGIMGIQDVDTRKLTTILRTKGAQRACLTTELDAAAAVKAAQESAPLQGTDLVSGVTTAEPYHWEGESRVWKLPNKLQGDMGYYTELPPVESKVVAYDFGIRRNLLRHLRRQGMDVTVVPADTPAETVLAMGPDGIFLSTGPGDPAVLTAIHAEVKKLAESGIPVFAAGLGMQLLAHAFGAKTEHLPHGHRGGQASRQTATGDIAITAGCQAFTVAADSLPAGLEATHTNLTDGTVEGIRHTALPVFGVQYSPEGTEHFSQFAEMVRSAKAAK